MRGQSRLPPDTWKVEPAASKRGGRRARKERTGRSMPQFPDRITAETLLSGAVEGSWENQGDEEEAIDWGVGAEESFSVEAEGVGDSSMMSGSALPEPPKLTSLQEREEQFFKDLYHNPNLQKSHPLSHMISGEAKLKSANAQLMKSKPMHSATRLSGSSIKGGVNFVGADASASPYNLVQKVKETKTKRGRGSRRAARKTASSSMAMPHSGSAPLQSVGPTESAIAHREFLLQTLQDVKDQLGNPPPFLDSSASAGLEETKEDAYELEYKEAE